MRYPTSERGIKAIDELRLSTNQGIAPPACGISIDLLSRTITAEGEMDMFWSPLSQAIVFGLSFATALTLIVRPAILAFPVAAREWVSSFRRRTSATSAPSLAAHYLN